MVNEGQERTQRDRPDTLRSVCGGGGRPKPRAACASRHTRSLQPIPPYGGDRPEHRHSSTRCREGRCYTPASAGLDRDRSSACAHRCSGRLIISPGSACSDEALLQSEGLWGGAQFSFRGRVTLRTRCSSRSTVRGRLPRPSSGGERPCQGLCRPRPSTPTSPQHHQGTGRTDSNIALAEVSKLNDESYPTEGRFVREAGLRCHSGATAGILLSTDLIFTSCYRTSRTATARSRRTSARCLRQGARTAVPRSCRSRSSARRLECVAELSQSWRRDVADVTRRSSPNGARRAPAVLAGGSAAAV